MPAKDKFLTLAKSIRREMDAGNLGFKSLNVSEIEERAKEQGGDNMRVTGKDGAQTLTECLTHVGLTAFPPLTEAPKDGYVRIIRTGSLLGSILVNLQTPGPGSDMDLAVLIRRIKRGDDDAPRGTDI